MIRTTRLELEMGGKIRPLLFDFSFLDLLSESEHYATLDEVGMAKPWRLIPIVALYGILAGADFEGKKADKEKIDLKVVTDWVQQMDPVDANQIVECYKSAMGFIGLALTGKAAVASVTAESASQ